MSRLRALAVLVALCVALWWYQGIAQQFALFGGTLAFMLNVAASLVTAVICVVLAAEAVIGIGIATLLAAQPTGFERAGIYALLGIAGLAAVLAHFGVDITTVLATSAVLTAIIGLALQSTLGGLIAGFTLHADRVLRIGDGVIQNGEAIIVTAIGWRSVTARKTDGSLVVMSSSRILDGTIEMVARGAPLRVEVTVVAPITVEPQRISALVGTIVTDLTMVAVGLPVLVAPAVFKPEVAQAHYRVRYWIRSFEDRVEVEEQVLGRLWYAFQREGIEWPVPIIPSTDTRYLAWGFAPQSRKEELSRLLRETEEHLSAATGGGLTAETALEIGTLLLYAAGERIVVPNRLEGCRCILLQGAVREISFELSSTTDHAEFALAETGQASRRMALQHLTSRLAGIIGPYAEFAVERAASREADLDRIGDIISQEIADPTARRVFVSQIAPQRNGGHGPGFSFALRRGATGALQPDPLLRATGAVAILAVP
ncbi:mechanosensitive ion channel family protein [Acidisoma sp. L85]|jgi:small-conductance mechanosensitive channel|uniref:mechanosensitive ion channel family protein n=1 Tax=Acidisoma sp. L85 TaxID=1641850 RepID=UPI00131A8B48|nr:mechanosensitive ion channel domain-containing protein [Acidisoma sp. L85]